MTRIEIDLNDMDAKHRMVSDRIVGENIERFLRDGIERIQKTAIQEINNLCQKVAIKVTHEIGGSKMTFFIPDSHADLQDGCP